MSRIRIGCILVSVMVLPVGFASGQSRAQFHAGDAAEALYAHGEYASAADAFIELARADEGNAYAWYRAGVAYRAAGDLERSTECLTRAATFPAYELDALLERARAETASGERDRAMMTLKDLVDRGYDRPERLMSEADLAPLREDDRLRALHRRLLDAPRNLNVRRSSWSPDGEWIAYGAMAPEHGSFDLYLIRPDGRDQQRLTASTDHDHDPSWSPDGERIAFIRIEPYYGRSAVWTINADGSGARRVSELIDGRVRMTDWSPDGDTLIYARWRGDDAQVWEIDMDSGDTQPLIENEQDKGNPVYAPDGKSVYYDARGEDDSLAIYRHDLESGERSTFLTGWWWWDVEFSPSGERLVAGRWEAGRGRFGRLAVIDVETRAFEVITPDEFDAWFPTWSPDGKWICFSRSRHPYGASGRSLWLVRADGTGLRSLMP